MMNPKTGTPSRNFGKLANKVPKMGGFKGNLPQGANQTKPMMVGGPSSSGMVGPARRIAGRGFQAPNPQPAGGTTININHGTNTNNPSPITNGAAKTPRNPKASMNQAQRLKSQDAKKYPRGGRSLGGNRTALSNNQ